MEALEFFPVCLAVCDPVLLESLDMNLYLLRCSIFAGSGPCRAYKEELVAKTIDLRKALPDLYLCPGSRSSNRTCFHSAARAGVNCHVVVMLLHLDLLLRRLLLYWLYLQVQALASDPKKLLCSFGLDVNRSLKPFFKPLKPPPSSSSSPSSSPWLPFKPLKSLFKILKSPFKPLKLHFKTLEVPLQALQALESPSALPSLKSLKSFPSSLNLRRSAATCISSCLLLCLVAYLFQKKQVSET